MNGTIEAGSQLPPSAANSGASQGEMLVMLRHLAQRVDQLERQFGQRVEQMERHVTQRGDQLERSVEGLRQRVDAAARAAVIRPVVVEAPPAPMLEPPPPPPPASALSARTEAEIAERHTQIAARFGGKAEPMPLAAVPPAGEPELPPELEPPRRRRGGGWLGLLLVVGILGYGGYWSYLNTGLGREFGDRAIGYARMGWVQVNDMLGRTVELPAAGTQANAAPAPTPAPSVPVPVAAAAAPAPGQLVDGPVPAVQPVAATVVAQAPPAEAPPPAETPAPAAEPEAPPAEAGPQLPAAPLGAVEATTIDPSLAPLPADAPAELVAIRDRALQGEAAAQNELATNFALGRGVPLDYERAAFWYGRAAAGDHPTAKYNLGVLTQRGEGVAQDSEAAFRLFLEAAEDGQSDAQIAVGLAYAAGRGVEQNRLQAASWLQRASAADNPLGAYHLGRLFEQGLDGAPDLTAAAGWYRIAAEAGNEQAQQALGRLTQTAAVPTTPPETPAGVPVPDAAPTPVAPNGDGAPGAVGPDQIREIQELLARLGQEPGPADGMMGARTRSAIENFQRQANLTVTGEPTQALLDALRQAAPGG